jgi:4-diphosphocytidyl-2-C-methyl-D-erythritol kinase
MIAFPNCKINIGLRITEKRPDGFHNIESIFVPVPWTEIVEIVPSENHLSEVEFKSSGIRMYGSKDSNLCLKAYRLLATQFSLPPVKIHLHKVLPIGAGLGGGSADAANTLILLNKIFDLKLNDADLETISAQIGSDCPFFIRNRPVFASGKGDEFENISLKLKGLFLVIIKPRIHVNTAEAYSWITPRKRTESLKEQIKLPLKDWIDCIENDFEIPVCERFPTIRNIKSRLYKSGAIYASMSGSGSSVYGIFEEEKNLNTYFRSSVVFSTRLD